MKNTVNRRHFLQQTSLLSAGVAALGTVRPAKAAASPNNKILIGVMGTNGRGLAHIDAFLALPNTEIACVCGVDTRAVDKGIAAALKRQQKKPQGVKDFRRILDDPAVDVLSNATPNHWHAPATILACARRQTCLCGKTAQLHARRRRDDGGRRPQTPTGRCRWAISGAVGFGKKVLAGWPPCM